MRTCSAALDPIVDQYLVVRSEVAPVRWRELADVLVLPDEPDEGTAHRAAVAALNGFPGCAATVTKVGTRFLAHTRGLQVLRFDPPSTAESCADRVHAWLLSAGASEDKRLRSDSACGPPICS